MKTTAGQFTVSTAILGNVAECMVFGGGDEVDSIRVPVANATKAHRHMVGLYRLGAVASYYAQSVGESAARAALRGDVRTIIA